MALTQLAGAMDVDVMAGSTDPANHALPQQPLHSCLLPGAVSFPTLHRYTSTTVDIPEAYRCEPGPCFLQAFAESSYLGTCARLKISAARAK